MAKPAPKKRPPSRRALSDWGRVLLLSPGHAEAEELIARASRLKQRRRIVRTIWISTRAVAACVGLAVLGQSALSRPKVAPPLHIVAAQQTAASAVPISADTDKAPVISVDDPSPVPAETDLGQDASTSKPGPVHRPCRSSRQPPRMWSGQSRGRSL
ncbi:MAG: hypothetical protein U0787_01710 [Polyangia bacterium]